MLRPFAFLIALVAFGAGCGPRAEPAEIAAQPDIGAREIAAHVQVLAHDSMEGRGTGSRGYEKAARYVEGRFAALGLRPAGTAGYRQPVPLRLAVPTRESALVLSRGGDSRELVWEQDFVLIPYFLRERIEVTAPVVLVGFGVTDSSRGYDDYRNIDARGKIVVVLTGAPASFPPTERAHHANGRVKAANAVRHGAVGMLVVRTRDQTFPWDRLARQLRAGFMRWLDPRGEPNDAFPELHGTALLSDGAAPLLLSGATQSLAQVLDSAARGAPPAFDLPLRATIRTVNTHRRMESPNVAGMLRGSDARLRDEVVVFTAHLDHLGIGEPVNGDSIYNGALDNAAGTGALLEVARAFGRLPRPPRRSVLFLAVTAEEMGLLGSDYFAGHPTVPIERIVANLNIDALSILYPLRELVPLGAQHSSIDTIAARAAATLDIALGPDPFPQEVFFVRSDQYSFVRRGVPSLFFFMGRRSDSGIDAAARFGQWMRTRYHTPQDDLGQPMDFEAGARHAQLAFLTGLGIANADARPVWKPGDFFGTMFGSR